MMLVVDLKINVGDACRQLKVHSVEDYRVLQSISYPAPILSVAMSVSVLKSFGRN